MIVSSIIPLYAPSECFIKYVEQVNESKFRFNFLKIAIANILCFVNNKLYVTNYKDFNT